MTQETSNDKLLDDSKFLSKSDREKLMNQKKHNVVSPILLAKALNVRPQMIYNYIREGRIKSFVDEKTGKKLITREEALKYCSKRAARMAEKFSQVTE